MSLIAILITLIIWGLILAVLWWAVSQIPVPEPFGWVIRVVFALIVAVVLISILTGGLPMVPLGSGRPLL
jgi:hypothetical protein